MSRSASPSSYMDAARAPFPRPAIEGLGEAGLLGRVSAREVGGMGEGPRAATAVIEPHGRLP